MRSDLRTRRRSVRTPAWVAAVLLCLALPAAAQQVYQWKDAQGVTHYTDTPPPGQAKSTMRTVGRKGATPQAAAAAPKPVANADCSNARSNLTVLQGKAPVGLDENKDGKPDRTLTDAERSSRTRLAEAAIDTYCNAPLDQKG